MIRTSRFVTNAALLFAALCCACTAGAPDPGTVQRPAAPLTLADHTAVCAADPRVQLNLVSLNVCVGADLFFREPFDGNGRTCGTCHPASNNFTIDPAFIASLPASDPLFIAEQVPALSGLEKPALMRSFGLILENVDGFESPTTKFLMRSVPHTLSLATSVTPQAIPTDGTTIPPNERTGWSGDGAPAPGELRDFQTGAITQHYTLSLDRQAGNDFRLATPDELDRIAAFMRSIGRSNELDLTTVTLSDAGAEQGRQIFLSPGARCNGCHSNAGANVGGANRNFDTGVERARLATLDAQGIPHDGGFGGQGLAAPNFDADRDTVNDSFGNGTFNTPPLVEAADTGPFFHTNAAATIEEAITFYTTATFASSPAGRFGAINLSPADIADVGRFLRVLNASFNCQMALRRLDAADTLVGALGAGSVSLQRGLLALALAEVNDALDVLSAVDDLNDHSEAGLRTAAVLINLAIGAVNPTARQQELEQGRAQVLDANADLGSGMAFTIGEGTLMF
jgi:cytochrome c peroxidase